jgi:hypothetical protein
MEYNGTFPSDAFPSAVGDGEWGTEHPLYAVYNGGPGGRWSEAETAYIAKYMIDNPDGVPSTLLPVIWTDKSARPIFHKCHVVNRLSLRIGWRKVRPNPHSFI